MTARTNKQAQVKYTGTVPVTEEAETSVRRYGTTATGIVFADNALKSDFDAACEEVGQRMQSDAWIVCDLAIIAHKRGWGTVAVIAERLGVKVQTLTNQKATAEFWKANDRNKAASFGIHDELRVKFGVGYQKTAGLTPEQAYSEAKDWLKKAVSQKLSVVKLRDAIDKARGKKLATTADIAQGAEDAMNTSRSSSSNPRTPNPANDGTTAPLDSPSKGIATDAQGNRVADVSPVVTQAQTGKTFVIPAVFAPRIQAVLDAEGHTWEQFCNIHLAAILNTAELKIENARKLAQVQADAADKFAQEETAKQTKTRKPSASKKTETFVSTPPVATDDTPKLEKGQVFDLPKIFAVLLPNLNPNLSPANVEKLIVGNGVLTPEEVKAGILAASQSGMIKRNNKGNWVLSAPITSAEITAGRFNNLETGS